MPAHNIADVCKFLGPMYCIRTLDGAETICRKINDKYEVEVTGFFGANKMTVNFWMRQPHTELLAIYSGIRSKEHLADVIGYLSFKYQNLSEQIQVDREDPVQ